MSDRFKNYDDEIRQLVLDFEENQRVDGHRYYDIDQLEIIIDFYLESLSMPAPPAKGNNSRETLRPLDFRNHNLLESAIAYARQLFPDAPSIRLREAHLYSVQGRYHKALSLLLELEHDDPENGDIQYALGTVYSALDQSRRAIQYYLKASHDGYQLGTVYGNVADEYYRLGRLEESLRYYKKAIAHSPDEDRSLGNLVATYDDLNLNAEAVSFFKQFVNQHPYSKCGWFSLGQSLMNFRDTYPQPSDTDALDSLSSDAIEAFQFVLTIDDSFFDAYVLIADCYQILRQPQKAIAVLREAMEYAADPVNVLFSISTIYEDSHNYQAAAAYLRRATDQDPYFSEAWLHLAECYSEMGDCDNAENLYQRALGMNSESDDFWIRYADFLIDQRRFPDAVELLQQGIVNADYPLQFNIRLAECYFYTNQRNAMFSILIDCLQNNDNLDELFLRCPEMFSDIEVVNLIQNPE